MIRRPPGSTRTNTLFPYTTLFRSASFGCIATGMMGRPTLSPLDTTLRSRIFMRPSGRAPDQMRDITMEPGFTIHAERSEEHTSELQSLMRISYAVFCLKQNTKAQQTSTSPWNRKHQQHQ